MKDREFLDLNLSEAEEFRLNRFMKADYELKLDSERKYEALSILIIIGGFFLFLKTIENGQKGLSVPVAGVTLLGGGLFEKDC